MATSGDTGTESTAYGDVGAGGKFRKMHLRKSFRPTTPYDRPLTVQKGNRNPNTLGDNNGGLFTRFVLDPASKLISYGAHRFFASVFRKRLTPPPLQESEINGDLSNELQVPVPNFGGQEHTGDASTQPLNSSPHDGISELEQLLKQKIFNRSEINHLTKLLKSRAAAEVSPVLDSPPNGETETNIGRRQPFLNSPLGREIKGGDLSHGVMSTPISKPRVIENEMASPTGLAKAYMGARPSQISPMHKQHGRKDLGLLGSAPFSSKLPILRLTGKTSVAPVAAKDGYRTPKSRGRSAIYNMARTPYSRFHLLRNNNETIIMNNGYGRQLALSSSHSRVEHNEKSDAKPMALKRRSSVLDDDICSVGPLRKIRQKRNLLGSQTLDSLRGVEIVSDFLPASSSQTYPVIIDPNKRVSKIAEKNENGSFQNESCNHVPSKSSEVAAKILEHLENLSPKEKSSESKLANARQKSPFRLTHSMLKGQALRSIEDVGSSKLFSRVLDDPKVEERSISTLLPTQDSIFEQQEKLKENTLKDSSAISNILNPVTINEFVPSSKGPVPSNGTSGAAVRISSTQLPETKKAFRMSAQEDFLEKDEEYLFEPASRPLMEGKEQAEAFRAGDKLSIPPKLDSCEKVTGGAVVIDEDSGNIPLSPEKTNTGIESEVLRQAALSAKEERMNNSSTKKPESSSEKSTSLVDVSPSAGSQLDIAVSEQGCHLNPLKTGDANGKSHTFLSTSLDGPHLVKPAVIPFSTSPSNETQVSTASSGFFTSSNTSIFGSLSTNAAGITSTSLTGFGLSSTSTPVTSGGDTAPVFGAPFLKFGTSVEQSTTAPKVSTSVSELADSETNAVKEAKFGISNGTYSTAANPGSNPSGLLSSTQFGSSVAFPSLSSGSAASLGTSSTSVLNPSQISGSSASSSSTQIRTGTLAFSSTGSHGNPVGSNSAAAPAPAPAIFSFGSSSGSSASTSTAAPNNVNTSPVFAFGGNSAPSSLTNTNSSLGSGSSGTFNFGSSLSVPSSAVGSLSSNSTTTSNLFSFSSPSPSTGFSFGALPSAFSANSESMVFNSSTGPSSNTVFSFTAACSPALSSSPLANNLPVFGSNFSSFTASPGNGDQMNAEDSMAEDPVQSSTPPIPVFGQPSVSPSLTGFMFRSTVPSPANPFQFSSQQNQIAHQNPSPFQASGSLEFNAGGSFSLGSSGTDKSSRKFVKVNRIKNRKK